MTTKKSEFTKRITLGKLWKRRSVKISAILVACVSVTLFLIPRAAKTYLQKWIVDSGADSAVIEKVRFNPFAGTAALEGVNVKKNGKTVFSNSTIYFNVGLKNLFGREAFLQQVTLSDILVDIESSKDGSMRVGSYSIAAQEPGADVTAKEVAEQIEKEISWIYRAELIHVRNVIVKYKQPDIQVELVIEEALIEKINTDPDDGNGNLTLKGTLNGSPISFDLHALVLEPEIDVQGKVFLADFRLDDLAEFLSESLKPFIGIAALDGEVAFSMIDNGDLSVAYDGLIKLDQGDIGGEGWGTKGTIGYNGKVSFTMNQNNMLVDVNGDLQALEASFNMPDPVLNVANSDINIKGKTLVSIAEEVVIDSSASLRLAGTKFDMDMLETSTADTIWDGHVLVETGTPAKEFLVRADGKLSIAEPAYSMDLAKAPMKVGSQNLAWNGLFEYSMGGPLEEKQIIGLNGSLTGADLFADISGMNISQHLLLTEADCKLTLAKTLLFDSNLSLHGEKTAIQKSDTVLMALAEVSMNNVRGNGSGGIIVESLQLKQFEMPSSPDVPVSVTVPQITISDIQSPDLLSGSIKQLYVKNPFVVDAEGKSELAAVDIITVNDINITEDMSVTVKDISVKKGVFLKDKGEKPLATLEDLLIDTINYSTDDGLVCDTINFNTVYADIIQKKSPQSEEPAKEPVEKTEKIPTEEGCFDKTGAEKTATGIPVKIRQIKVTGKSGFKFVDESLPKNFMTIFAIKSLQVDDIDLNEPEHLFSYSLKGDFDKYSPLQVDGKCAPLATDFTIDQKVSLRNLSMQHVSPYTMGAIGTFFPDGFLTYTSELKIGDARIDMSNSLVFNDLKAESLKGELADELNNQLPIPLDLALSMLRDSDGVIDLDIPIDGKLSELNVGVTDIIVTALGKGITVAVAPYLAYTVLGPAGALAFVGVKVGQSLLQTELPVLEFESGSIELSEEHEESLQEVAEEIVANEKMIYSICAKVTPDEVSVDNSTGIENPAVMQNEAFRLELFQLGEKRSLLVKEYLLSNFKIGEERLLICNPGVEFEKDSKAKILFKASENE